MKGANFANHNRSGSKGLRMNVSLQRCASLKVWMCRACGNGDRKGRKDEPMKRKVGLYPAVDSGTHLHIYDHISVHIIHFVSH